MKIMTILGTRPEIIRLSRIIPKLDELCEHVLVHTGQNYDRSLKDVFFEELGVREPDHYLGTKGSFGEQVAVMFPALEKLMREEAPDRLLILGDTNSGLAAVVAKRMGIAVYHMEAGNRCYDDRVPEEVNRRIIDHSSDILMPYTENSRQNLLAEGIPGNRIYVTGNPIKEVIDHYSDKIAASRILETLSLTTDYTDGTDNEATSGKDCAIPRSCRSRDSATDGPNEDAGALCCRTRDSALETPSSVLCPQDYFLVTMHRAENVDIEPRLRNLTQALHQLHETYKIPVIISTHPRTKARMETFGIDVNHDDIRFLEPFGFFDFIALEKNAKCVLSDSGTVQEECCIFGVPNVTIRDVTERPETIECGSNILAGACPEMIRHSVRIAMRLPGWNAPEEYRIGNVSGTTVRVLLGYRRK